MTERRSSSVKDSGGLLADLRRVQADPDLSRVLVSGPEPHELVEVTGPLRLLPGDGAVHGDLVPDDVLEDAIVSRRLAAFVVLGLQAID